MNLLDFLATMGASYWYLFRDYSPQSMSEKCESFNDPEHDQKNGCGVSGNLCCLETPQLLWPRLAAKSIVSQELRSLMYFGETSELNLFHFREVERRIRARDYNLCLF